MIRTRIKRTYTRVDGADVVKFQAQILEFPAYLRYHQLIWKFRKWGESDELFVKRIEFELGEKRGTLMFCMKLIDLFYKTNKEEAVAKERQRLIDKSRLITFIKYP